MISSTPQKVPEGQRDLQVYLLKILRDHYQDLLDIYSGEAELGDSIILVGEDSKWRLYVDGEFLRAQKWVDDEWKTANSFSRD